MKVHMKGFYAVLLSVVMIIMPMTTAMAKVVIDFDNYEITRDNDESVYFSGINIYDNTYTIESDGFEFKYNNIGVSIVTDDNDVTCKGTVSDNDIYGLWLKDVNTTLTIEGSDDVVLIGGIHAEGDLTITGGIDNVLTTENNSFFNYSNGIVVDGTLTIDGGVTVDVIMKPLTSSPPTSYSGVLAGGINVKDGTLNSNGMAYITSNVVGYGKGVELKEPENVTGDGIGKIQLGGKIYDSMEAFEEDYPTNIANEIDGIAGYVTLVPHEAAQEIIGTEEPDADEDDNTGDEDESLEPTEAALNLARLLDAYTKALKAYQNAADQIGENGDDADVAALYEKLFQAYFAIADAILGPDGESLAQLNPAIAAAISDFRSSLLDAMQGADYSGIDFNNPSEADKEQIALLYYNLLTHTAPYMDKVIGALMNALEAMGLYQPDPAAGPNDNQQGIADIAVPDQERYLKLMRFNDNSFENIIADNPYLLMLILRR